MCADRLRDIFNLLLAEISKGQGQLGADLILHCTRDTNSVRLRKSLQPSGDIYGIPEEIVALHDDVADVDADAEPHLLARGPFCILFGYGLLNFDGALNGIHGTGEVGQDAVARRVEDSTPM